MSVRVAFGIVNPNKIIHGVPVWGYLGSTSWAFGRVVGQNVSQLKLGLQALDVLKLSSVLPDGIGCRLFQLVQ